MSFFASSFPRLTLHRIALLFETKEEKQARTRKEEKRKDKGRRKVKEGKKKKGVNQKPAASFIHCPRQTSAEMGTEYREKSELVTVDGQPEPLRTSSTSMDAGMADLLAASEGIDEAKLVRKLDWHLIPLIMSVYLFSFIDRYVHLLHHLRVCVSLFLAWSPSCSTSCSPGSSRLLFMNSTGM